jgi:hypothetical protein
VGGLWPQLLGSGQILVGLLQVPVVNRHPGAGGVEHQAGHALLQVGVGDHRPGLVDQGLSDLPILAADGQDGPLGQSNRGRDGRPAVLGHLDRLGQDAVGQVLVAGQQVRDAQQQLGRGPPEATHRDQGQSQLGVGPHLPDPAAAQLGERPTEPEQRRGTESPATDLVVGALVLGRPISPGSTQLSSWWDDARSRSDWFNRAECQRFRSGTGVPAAGGKESSDMPVGEADREKA